VPSFADGLKYGLRQDPDVMLVGEVRDSETARMVISAAETGHLVLTTVHTRDARGAITRMVDIFPSHRQDDIRAQLALSLQMIVSQHLLPSMNAGEKRILATEVLVATDSIRSAIRLNKIESIDNAIQTGKRHGMHTLDEDLQRLFFEQKISSETARRFSKNPA
jgi:twitching motility protein PilT